MEFVLKNIKIIRKKLKLSSQYMGKALSIDASNYNRMENGESTLTLERFYQIARVFRLEPEDILTYGKSGNVMYIPVNVRAGGLTEYLNECVECVTFHFPLIPENDLKAVIVDGDSMYPTFAHGDNVFVKKEETPRSLKWGEPYVIDAGDGRVIKRVYQHEKDKELISLVSDNEVYKPYTIHFKDILSIWRVKGKFSKNLSPVR